MSAILAALVQFLTGGLVDKVVGLGQAYFQKQISQAEFESRVRIAAEEAAARVEADWARAATEISGQVQATLRASVVLQRTYAAVLFLQLGVLLWYQIGAPAYLVITGQPWPDPGVTLEWAYLLVGAQIGAGPLVFRQG